MVREAIVRAHAAVFSSTHPFAVFDWLRVPYTVSGDGDGSLASVRCGDRALAWPLLESTRPIRHALLGGSIPVFARFATEGETAGFKARLGGDWVASEPLTAEDGPALGSVWTGEAGIFLPFDPGEAVLNLWTEAYKGQAGRGGASGAAKAAYYRLRPLMPRGLQIALRRVFARIQARTAFPRWPVESALHDLCEWVLASSAAVAGEPVPFLAPWPDGKRWALVLTHDVETESGFRALGRLRGVEEPLGYRSSFNFVPKRYAVDDETVAELSAAGFEIGVHGLYHDGRDLESRAVLDARLPEIREYARRWKSVGFRSPATRRVWELMPLLGFDYDSSYPDTDPYEPDAGGCCSWLPFFNDDLVELPITLPQDHTLFVILRRNESAWIEKADYLRARGGMALLIVHPDYMLEAEPLAAYERFLRRYADDPEVWRALPAEVSAWWRRRADSQIVRTDSGWTVEGPAFEEALVQLVTP